MKSELSPKVVWGIVAVVVVIAGLLLLKGVSSAGNDKMSPLPPGGMPAPKPLKTTPGSTP